MKQLKIAVYGSAAGNTIEKNIQKAREVGKEIAKNKGILVNGACNGIPYEAAMSAHNAGGMTIGFSASTCLNEHKKSNDPIIGKDKLVFIPRNYEHRKNIHSSRKYRNISSAVFCDAAIVISGRTGTLNEFIIAYDLSKVIGVLKGSGGIADNIIPTLISSTDKKRAKIIFDKDPRTLVKKVIAQAREK